MTPADTSKSRSAAAIVLPTQKGSMFMGQDEQVIQSLGPCAPGHVLLSWPHRHLQQAQSGSAAC